jgi:FtsH-binding integral membrane protein
VYATDLLALRRRAESDSFSKWVSERLLPWYHLVFGRYIHKKNPHRDNEVSYNDSLILKAASMSATMLAALLIVAPVVVLDEINSMRVRLGLMSVFTVVFSLCVARLTGAKRTDVFAATAAFAAVQAVFLGSSTVGPVTLISAGGLNGTSFVQMGLGVK